ncbi:MAG: YceD family protein [Acidocella sp.]|nr:YceD family protein [Acidocella sp.]
MDEEFSRIIKAGNIKETPQHHKVVADERALKALAVRFGLPGIAHLSGEFRLWHERGGTIAATLVMQARVTQICVVTLEPFDEEILEEGELRFVPAKTLPEGDEGEKELSPESLEGPDEIPYTDDSIDLGAALAEQLALALPPYPRRPGAEMPDEAADNSASPFSVLAGKFRKPE